MLLLRRLLLLLVAAAAAAVAAAGRRRRRHAGDGVWKVAQHRADRRVRHARAARAAREAHAARRVGQRVTERAHHAQAAEHRVAAGHLPGLAGEGVAARRDDHEVERLKVGGRARGGAHVGGRLGGDEHDAHVRQQVRRRRGGGGGRGGAAGGGPRGGARGRRQRSPTRPRRRRGRPAAPRPAAGRPTRPQWHLHCAAAAQERPGHGDNTGWSAGGVRGLPLSPRRLLEARGVGTRMSMRVCTARERACGPASRRAGGARWAARPRTYCSVQTIQPPKSRATRRPQRRDSWMLTHTQGQGGRFGCGGEFRRLRKVYTRASARRGGGRGLPGSGRAGRCRKSGYNRQQGCARDARAAPRGAAEARDARGRRPGASKRPCSSTSERAKSGRGLARPASTAGRRRSARAA